MMKVPGKLIETVVIAFSSLMYIWLDRVCRYCIHQCSILQELYFFFSVVFCLNVDLQKRTSYPVLLPRAISTNTDKLHVMLQLQNDKCISFLRA